MSFSHGEIEKAIKVSQHCQRNWDLSRVIPDEDLKVLATAVDSCPSKQNVAFYRAHFVMNRELIEKVHNETNGFTVTYEPLTTTTNPQVLANLLVVFEPIKLNAKSLKAQPRNTEIEEFCKTGGAVSKETDSILERDAQMAIGIAAGYVNLSAALLGYATGCCACFDASSVKEILGLENEPMLLMGVGFKQDGVGRRIHHKDNTFLFPTKQKEKIEIKIIR